MDKKWVAVGIVILSVLIIVWYVLKPEPMPIAPEPVNKPDDMTLTGNTIVAEKEGKKLWELMADSISIDQETQVSYLKMVRGTVYRDDGDIINITADSGAVDKNQNFQLQGNVKGLSAKGLKLAADEVGMLTADKKAWAKGNVLVANKESQITGDNLDTDANFIKIHMTGHVVAERIKRN